MMNNITYDVIIVGGGAAGVGAAMGAKIAVPNSRVLLLESQGFLGGAATHRGVHSYCGLYSVEDHPRRVAGPVWTNLHQRLVKLGAAGELPDVITGYVQNIEPEGLKCALDDMLLDVGVEVLLHSTVIGAQREFDRVTSVEIYERRGRRHIRAKAFVDCSGDGDLACHAGASTRYGNHGHVNMGSLVTRFGGLAQANPTFTAWRDAILAAKEENPELNKIIPRNVGVLVKIPASGDICTYLASATYDARDSASITAAERSGRKQAQIYLEILRRLPRHENMHLVYTGPNFGTRESRHINARYQLTERDILEGRAFEDTITVAGWYMEWHDASKEDWPIRFQCPPKGTFNVPLRCLHSIDTENLYCAGRCVDGDQKASSAVRVMGTALVTGQAAGTAAALTASLGRSATAKEVQEILRENGVPLDRHNLEEAPVVAEPEGRNFSHTQALASF